MDSARERPDPPIFGFRQLRSGGGGSGSGGPALIAFGILDRDSVSGIGAATSKVASYLTATAVLRRLLCKSPADRRP